MCFFFSEKHVALFTRSNLCLYLFNLNLIFYSIFTSFWLTVKKLSEWSLYLCLIIAEAIPFTRVVFESSFLLYSLAKNSFIVSLYFWKRYIMIFKKKNWIIEESISIFKLCVSVQMSDTPSSSPHPNGCFPAPSPCSTLPSPPISPARSGVVTFRSPATRHLAHLDAWRRHSWEPGAAVQGNPNNDTRRYTHSRTAFNVDWFIVSSSRSVIHILSLSCTQC